MVKCYQHEILQSTLVNTVIKKRTAWGAGDDVIIFNVILKALAQIELDHFSQFADFQHTDAGHSLTMATPT